jgi:hypothetical protein
VAAAAGTDERGMQILLDALAALGLLEANGAYALSPLAEAFLVSSRPSYVGAFVNVLAGDWAWAGYPRLAEAVRTGGTVLEEDADSLGCRSGRRSPARVQASQLPLHRRSPNSLNPGRAAETPSKSSTSPAAAVCTRSRLRASTSTLG